MDLNTALAHALNGNAVLFAGSGFSYLAENLKNQSPLSGTGFAKQLNEFCGLNTNNDNLAIASQFYIRKFGEHDLAELCRNSFTIKRAAPHHVDLLSVPWQRIYTTNYDDLIEKSAAENSKALTSVTLEDDPVNYATNTRTCVHINGFINTLSPGNLRSTFKLTSESYLTDNLTNSKWCTIFRQDITMAHAVIFIGYSLYDLDIQRILFSEDIKSKCIFITAPSPSEVDEALLPIFGELLPIGVQAAATALNSLKNVHVPPPPSSNFLSLTEFSLAPSTRTPTNSDIEKLFLYGTIQSELINHADSGLEGRPYIARRQSLEPIPDLLYNDNDVVITSDLGNGKTVSVEYVIHELAAKGFRVHRFSADNKAARKEVNSIIRFNEPTVIVIDNYVPYLDFIDFVSMRRTGRRLRFLLTARSHVHEAFRERLEESLKTTDIAEIDINRLSSAEIQSAISLIDSYGLWAEFSAYSDAEKFKLVLRDCDAQIHQLLLKIYNSPQISEKISEIFKSLTSEVRRVVIGVFILNAAGFNSDRTLINELLDGAPLIKLSNTDRNTAKLFWDDSTGRIRLKSSVLAEYYLTNLSEASEAVEILIEMFSEAHKKRKLGPEYDSFMRSLMSFSSLQKMLPRSGLRNATVHFYEAIQNQDFTRKNPHYWLQYAIARLSFEDDLAEIGPYFQSSYKFSQGINYDTYQIDNHYARFLLVKATRNRDADSSFELYKEAKGILSKQMLHEKKHYPYRVAASISEFVSMHLTSLSSNHKSDILRFCEDVVQRIKTLPSDVKSHKHVRNCSVALEKTITNLTPGANL
ncbi:SIR2 family protein [Pseudomonas sp. SP16.1]|uniref:SIR2 family protein n=1 Tax=Pseudomonas sp. SP16.1 TaxID=3458854 RepID=UPI0040466AFD